MGWRLRRSFKIAPGVRLNISRSGVGVSAGVKGLRVGVGPHGPYTSVGIPGTGLYRIDYLKARTAVTTKGAPTQQQALADLPFTLARPPEGISWPVLFAFAGVGLAIAAIGEPADARLGMLFTAAVISLSAGMLLWRRLANPRRRAWQLFERARVLLAKDLSQAATLAECAVQIDGELSEAKFLAGVAFHDVDEHEKAATYLNAINCGASRTFAPILADSLFHLERYDEAVEVMQGHPYGLDEDNLDEKDVIGVTLLGRCFAAKGDHRTATEVFERLTRRRRMNPEMAALRYSYARSLEAMGNAKKAISELRKVVAFDVEFADAQERLSDLGGRLVAERAEEEEQLEESDEETTTR